MCLVRDKIVSLSARVGEKTCSVIRMPEHAPQLQAWCARLGVEYYGGGLASTSLAIIQELLRKKRRSIGEEERQLVLEQSEGVCHLCGGTLDENWECSHVLRLSRQSAEEEEVIRAACQECHAEQTAKESIDDTGWAPMTSVFCQATWEQFC